MLNVNAKEFVPLEVTMMFDKLENEYVKNNEWLFNYECEETEELRSIDLGKYYYGIKEDKKEILKKEKFVQKLKTITEEITYADMLKN